MANAAVSGAHDTHDAHLIEAARRAVELIWQDHPDARTIPDPRTSTFADAVIDGLARALKGMPGAIAEVVSGAASAAEDLNVDPFQGLVEIIQNADDLGATEVRFAVRPNGDRFQLLVVHNGAPVVCQNVLAMALPFLTTKRDDPKQKGRFGIGLNTLARISTCMAVHSKPYHFSVEHLAIGRIVPESSVDRFYGPLSDTLIVLDLVPDFREDALRQWFDSWEAAGLVFLGNVCSFRWCDLSGHTLARKNVSATAWEPAIFVDQREQTQAVRRRTVRADTITWTVFSADVPVPSGLERSHKAKSDSATVSIALPEKSAKTGIFVAFRTRVPTGLSISIDAQFDPSTAREELLDNSWNSWLIDRVADLIADVACGLLASDPKSAWQIIPLPNEKVGNNTTQWPRVAFDKAFQRIRDAIGARAALRLGDQLVALNTTAYEETIFSGLLDAADIELLVPPRKAVSMGARDEAGRWRKVLDEIGLSQVVDLIDVLHGFHDSAFREKPPQWWAMAADRITTHHPRGLFTCPFWLTSDHRAVSCDRAGGMGRPLVFGDAVSGFASKWNLFDRLHEVYGQTQEGKRALDWLARSAVFTTAPDAETELAAFAAIFRAAPRVISDEDLRDLRDRFDALPDRRAEALGHSVGAALLLDGFTFENGQRQGKKVSPTRAYLPRTLDSEHPYWPEAAGTISGIAWLSASYEEKLKTKATRSSPRRVDGRISRGPRKFLVLLGAESAPRLVTLDTQYDGPIRRTQLWERGARYVENDWHSPALTLVLDGLLNLPKKQRRLQSSALLKALSRHWDRVYASKISVQALRTARKYTYRQGFVATAWLCKLRETKWIAVGNGDLVTPDAVVIRTAQTETLYSKDLFACEIKEGDVSSQLASELKLITDVRASDLVVHLEQIRDGQLEVEHEAVLQTYRALASLCPKNPYYPIGDVSPRDLQQRFSHGKGLISIRPGEWKKPEEVFSGKDIFRQPELFVPGGPTYSNLWSVVGVRPPGLAACIRYCRRLAQTSYSSASEAILIDVYRHMEPLLAQADRSQKDNLRRLPLACFGQWTNARPIYHVEDRELRTGLDRALADHHFWTPPCDLTDLPELTATLELIRLDPVLTVIGNRQEARDFGNSMRPGFRRSVDQLSNELARNDVSTRERITITWNDLREIPLFVYDQPFDVEVREPHLGGRIVIVEMKALLSLEPRELHVSVDGLQQRENCGRAVASLFPLQARWKIENAWVASWIASQEAHDVERMRFASDEDHAEKLAELAERVEEGKNGNVRAISRAARTPKVKPRVLKSFQGQVTQVTVHGGSPPTPPPDSGPKPLVDSPPAASQNKAAEAGPAPVAYSSVELEQRGWEILSQVLTSSNEPELVDFRKRHGVGADGAVDWKTFVELKASGRESPTSVQMTNSEFQRAKERGLDYILALVSGLEEGQTTEIRLILDPTNRVTLRPVQGMRLVRIAEAPAVIIRLDDNKVDEAAEDSGS
jgi:hypothetical protein